MRTEQNDYSVLGVEKRWNAEVYSQKRKPIILWHDQYEDNFIFYQ